MNLFTEKIYYKIIENQDFIDDEIILKKIHIIKKKLWMKNFDY